MTKNRSGLLATALAISAICVAPALAAEELNVERLGVYVAADDLDRATAFYEALFGEKPQVRTPNLVGFDVGGGLYAVVSRKAYALPKTPGGSTRPYLKVADLDTALGHVQRLAPGDVEGQGIVREGAFGFFRFKDSEGNLVEFFAIDSGR